jgi:hypothetical protein
VSARVDSEERGDAVPRIPEVDEAHAGFLTRMTYRYSRRQFGKALAPLRVIAHSERSMLAYGAYEMLSARANALPPKLKTLASIKTSTLVGCPF